MELRTSEKLKILFDRKGLSITDVAKKVGWSQSNLSNKLSRNNFSENDLRKIADAIGCNLSIDFEDKN